MIWCMFLFTACCMVPYNFKGTSMPVHAMCHSKVSHYLNLAIVVNVVLTHMSNCNTSHCTNACNKLRSCYTHLFRATWKIQWPSGCTSLLCNICVWRLSLLLVIGFRLCSFATPRPINKYMCTCAFLFLSSSMAFYIKPLFRCPSILLLLLPFQFDIVFTS